MSTAKKFAELSGIFLIFLGAALNAYGLYLDKVRPNYFLVLDLEIAGILAILAGVIYDVIANHV